MDLEQELRELPLEQLVHVIGALVDRDGIGWLPLGSLPRSYQRAIRARWRRDEEAAEQLIAELIIEPSYHDDAVGAAVLAAPLLSPARLARLESLLLRAPDLRWALGVLLAILPDASASAPWLLGLAQDVEGEQRALILGTAAPLFRADADLARARAASMTVPEPLRRQVVIALDARPEPATFWDEVRARADDVARPARWWRSASTTRLTSAVASGELPPLRDVTSLLPRITAGDTLSVGRGGPDALNVWGFESYLPRSGTPELFPDELVARRIEPRATRSRRRRQQVGVGFVRPWAPERPWRTWLRPRAWYYLWIEIGPELAADSLGGAAPMPAIADGAELEVIVFGFPGQLHIAPGFRRGRLRISASGPASVIAPAATPAGQRDAAAHRLFVPVRAPATPGPASLRVNLHHRGLLLQSHRVTAHVAGAPRSPESPADGAPSRLVDYTLSASLDVTRLARAEHGVSILVNDDGSGTHNIRLTAGDFTATANISVTALAAAITYARDELRTMAWGSPTPFVSVTATPYRYATRDQARLEDDLINLARRGYALWADAIAHFGVRGPHKVDDFQARLRATNTVQLALVDAANNMFPAAILYDHPLDSNGPLRFCPAASDALRAQRPLEAEPCFLGACPNHGQLDVVCPAGFWGFRHDLGVPPDLGLRGEVANTIGPGSRAMLAAVSTDQAFADRDAHLDRLRPLWPAGVSRAESRDRCFELLKGRAPQVVYFFCHGGLSAPRTPFLEIGPPNSTRITAADFTTYKVWWGEPPDTSRPLVVLNGCHTTAVSPEESFNLVDALIVRANAAGVIGTEITIFEPLAIEFGEKLFGELARHVPVGAAIRRARLALLRAGNPLGLVYIPFALATAAIPA